MDRNEAFTRVRNLANEYKAIKYLEEALEAAVNAENSAVSSVAERDRVLAALESDRAELVRLDTEVAARRKLAEDTQKSVADTIRTMQTAAADAAQAASDKMAAAQDEMDKQKAEHVALMNQMQQVANDKLTRLETEFAKALAGLTQEKVKVEQNLAKAKTAYAEFLGKVAR